MPKPIVTRPVVYPRVSVAVCASPEKSGIPESHAAGITEHLRACPYEATNLVSYNPPLSHLDARTLIGWTVEEEGGEKFGDDFLLLDRRGKKVRCTKNVRNRPLYLSLVEDRVQDILNGRWELNGETVIISKESDVLDGQHTLVALILSYEDWLLDVDAKSGERKWLDQWPEDKYPDGPVIDKIIVYGIDSSDRVVNTMNTGKPRSLADVLYRSPYFAALPAKDSKTNVDRVTAGRITSSAIWNLWLRTGMYHHGFGSRRTTAEAVAWLESHGGKSGKLLASVRHILESNKDGKITNLVGLGYAATICFLMSASGTDKKAVGKYYGSDERKSKGLDFSLWDKAEEFWTEFGKCKEPKEGEDTPEPTGKLKELTLALRRLLVVLSESLESDAKKTGMEKDYVICAAWERFSVGKSVRFEDVTIKYTDPDPTTGYRKLDKLPLVGGIDLGTEKVPTNDDEGLAPTPEVEEQVENGKHDAEEARRKVAATPITSAAAQGVESLLALVREEHEGLGCVLVKTPKGDYDVWGEVDCAVVAPHVTKKPRLHPKGVNYIRFKAEEAEILADVLTDSGMNVGFIVESVAPVNGDPRYTMERKCFGITKRGKK